MNIETADRLIELRKRRGLSQEQLAELLGVSRQAVSKWERAESGLDVDNAISLSRLYNISLDELFGNKPEYERELDMMEPDSDAEETDNNEEAPEEDFAQGPVGEYDEPVEGAPDRTEAAVGGFVSDIMSSVDTFTDRRAETAPDGAQSGAGEYAFEGVRSFYCSAKADLTVIGTDSGVCTVRVEGPEKEASRCRLWMEDDELRIITEEEKRSLFSLLGRTKLRLRVVLPRPCERAEADLKGGDLSVSGVAAGTLCARTGGGDIGLEGCRFSVLEAKTGGGDLGLDGVAAERADLVCGGGDIELNGADVAGTLLARTGGGDVGGRVSASVAEIMSGGGDLDLALDARTVEVKTGGGDIKIVCSGASVVNAKTGGGDVALTLKGCTGITADVAAMGEAVVEFGGSIVGAGRKLGLTCGDGSTKLGLRSGGGDIRVRA